MPWDIIAPISTFAVASANPNTFFATSWHLAGYFLTALASLAQTIAYLPSPSKSKLLLLTYLLVPILTIHREAISNYSLPPTSNLRPSFGHLSLDISDPIQTAHPVQQLIEESRARFSAMIERQSKTLEQAVAEYRRRYNMDPPPGFETWFEFAKTQNSFLIDEFDSIYESFSPYWQFSAATLRKNMRQASKLDKHLFLCQYEDGTFKGDCGWQGSDIKLIMSSVAHLLPDFEFLLNEGDGSRVLLSSNVEQASQDVVFHSYDGQAIWDMLTASCPQHDNGLSTQNFSPNISSHGLPFIQNIHQSKDICQHPEYAREHALFISPVDAKFTRQAVPILSQAKTSLFSDILMPSVYYYSTATGGKYNPDVDPEWSKKTDRRLYWAGSTTGGLNHKGLWRNFQRQRFVGRTSHLDDPNETYLTETKPGIWNTYQSSEHLSLYDIKFTAYIQCEPQTECEQQANLYGRHEREGRPKMYQHRLCADIDGNSYSGRWYSILRSHSTPFKQTIYREWHDDRLFPWVHYVPMSVSFDEVPELTRYLSQTDIGDKLAKEIANQGREWFQQALRWEDFQVYFFRLALEYARLLDDDREVKLVMG
jgi:hypothetical protein